MVKNAVFNVFSRRREISRIFLNNRWYSMPESGGIIEGTGLSVQFTREQKGPWSLKKARFHNGGAVPVKLGACHLVEFSGVSGSGPEDTVFLDSGGGWFSGTLNVMSSMPNCEYEYMNDMFTPVEDLRWVSRLRSGDTKAGVHYSLGGYGAYRLASSGKGFVAGFVLPLSRFNSIPFFVNDRTTGRLKGFALSCNFAGYELEPGAYLESEEAVYGSFAEPQAGLEEYASFCAERRNIHLRHQTPPVGWLSWYGYRLTITEEEIDRVADFINREYPGFGFKYMQIDLGYNRDNLPGAWFETNDHFKKGLMAFADSMRAKGFVPGIWCCLFQVCEGSGFIDEHPEAALTGYRRQDGKWFWEPYAKSYYLDPTNPDAKDFMKKTLRYFKSLGIKYFKIDFMNRLARTDGELALYEPSVGRGAGAYREGLKLILDELDPEDYLYSCSNLVMHSVGLCSTSMTACDIGNTGFRRALLEGRGDGGLRFFASQMKTTMSRYFTNGKLLMLNPDSINIAPPADFEEAWMRILFVGIAGGQIFLGDKFDLAEPEVRHMVREVLPPAGVAARPVDIFASCYPEQFQETYHIHTDAREIFAVFNLNCREQITVDLGAAGLDSKQEYYLWEFRERRFMGIVRGSFTAVMPKASARLYALTPVSDGPAVIGTTFHILQGQMELSEVKVRRSGRITGKLTRPAGDCGSIIIHDCGSIHQVHVTGEGTPVRWQYKP